MDRVKSSVTSTKIPNCYEKVKRRKGKAAPGLHGHLPGEAQGACEGSEEP